MSQNDRYLGGAHKFAIDGDVFPGNVDYSDPILTPHLFKMYHRNEFVEVMCDWMVAEAFRNWIKFIEDDKPIEGIKFGQPYTFEGYEYEDDETGKTIKVTPFQEYLQWNDVPVNWKQGVSWSRLYNEGALLVFLDENQELYNLTDSENNIIEWKANPDPQGYKRFKVFQPKECGTGTGFYIANAEDCNTDGTPKVWTVIMHDQYMKSAKTFRIEADRCIHLLWKKRQNGWKACSRVLPFLRFAKMEELTFQKLTKRAHDLAGGILHIDGIASEEEQDTIDDAMGDDLTSVDRVYTKAGRTVEYKTPDLKAANEFESIFKLYTKKMLRFMRMTEQTLDGEKQGAGLGGNTDNDVSISYTEIYEIQEHYRNYLEKVFYKLGKENTQFIYREVLPEGMRMQKEMNEKMMENEEQGDEPAGGSAKDTNPRDQQSSGKKSAPNSREQTR